jgi:hypothetical protein
VIVAAGGGAVLVHPGPLHRDDLKHAT